MKGRNPGTQNRPSYVAHDKHQEPPQTVWSNQPIDTPKIRAEVIQSEHLFGFSQSPFVDCENNCLYFADTYVLPGAPHIYRYDISSKVLYPAVINDPNDSNATFKVSGIVPVKSDRKLFIVSINNCLSHVVWDGKSKTAIKKKIFIVLIHQKEISVIGYV